MLYDLYGQLFGRTNMANGSVIDMAEHGRVGGVSTGQPFKFVSSIDPNTGTNSEDSNTLLRRIVKLLESQAVVDIQNRQKVTIDSVTANSLTTAGFNTALVGNIVTTGAPTLGTIAPLPIWEGPVDQRFRIMDAARLTYDQGIRSHLAFT